MADYQRLISYMYRYENGIKKNNIGYVRLETRNDQLKATIHLQIPMGVESILPTYFILWRDGEMELIFIGDTVAKNQMMDAKLLMKASNINNSGYSFNQMGGLIILADGQNYYGTEWSDIDIQWEQVLNALRLSQEKYPQDDVKDDVEKTYQVESQTREFEQSQLDQREYESEQEQEELVVEASQLEEVNKLEELNQLEEVNQLEEPYQLEEDMFEQEEYQAKQENISQSEENQMKEQSGIIRYNFAQYNEMEEPVLREDLLEDVQENNESDNDGYLVKEMVSASSLALEQEEDIEGFVTPNLYVGLDDNEHMYTSNYEMDYDDDSPVARDIFSNCAKMYPFEDKEVINCVKMDLQDMNRFPTELRNKLSNSFLLHGYYSYHHILFIKLNDQGENRYFLGIPGIFQNRERNMARMFGFEYFKGIKNKELQPGEFGYWFMRVEV